MLRKAPREADSVGVMMPVNVVPRTSAMTTAKGSRSHMAVSFSRAVYFLFGPGRQLGIAEDQNGNGDHEEEGQDDPGDYPPAKSRATETSCQPP